MFPKLIMAIDGKHSEESLILLFSAFTHILKFWRTLLIIFCLNRKYSTSDKLSYLVVDCVDHTIKTIIDKEGFDKEFIPFEYIYNTFLNIIASSAFGKRYYNFQL